MRAKLPTNEGFVDRDGVRIHYEVYGEGPQAMLFVPPWSIVHSRVYKAQFPYFSERFRCIAYDARGNGLSDRPDDVAAYSFDHGVADALAVLEATNAGEAILVGLSLGGMIACCLAAYHPERVKAVLLAGTAAVIGPGRPQMGPKHFLGQPENFEGGNKYNRAYWLTDYPDFAEHFVRNICSEPHSTKQIEDGIGWANETIGPVLVKTVEARSITPKVDIGEAMYRKIRCPVLGIHGDDDQIQPHARGKLVAELIQGSEFVTIPGGGHNPLGRYPAKCNALINDFVDRRLGLGPPRPRTNRAARDKKVLYLSSPIGLGHGRRDIAIANALRRYHPGLRIDWLAQDPVTRLLEANGERLHPLSARLASESRHIELEAGEHDLHAFQAIRRMDEVLIANFMIFQDAVESCRYDLVVADEAWDIDHYWHEHPELKKASLAWFTDFVGFVPMPEGGAHEAFLTADYNAEMIGHIERHPGVRDRAIFVGTPDDIVPLGFGKDLPAMRDWIPRHFDFSGYVLGEHPDTFGPRGELRTRLHRHGGRLGRGHPSHQAHPARLANRPRQPARAAHGAGRRPTHRSALARRADWGRDARFRARSRPPFGGLRPRPGARRADDLHGAGGGRHAVPVLSIEESFRAELSRRPPAGSLRRRSAHGVCRLHARDDRRGHGRRTATADATQSGRSRRR
jgi:pimeloyl-ACP methyl ester carboxylesterase